MTTNIDACIFLPGRVANGSEDINVPLMALPQIEKLLKLYRHNSWAPFFPYVGAAYTLMRSNYICDKTPLINRWIKILNACEYKCIDQILSLVLLKYGWDIPQNVVDRCLQYATHITSGQPSYYKDEKFSHQKITMDADDFEMSRILHQLDHKGCMEHLTYIAEYCIGVVRSMPELDTKNIMVMLSPSNTVPSNLQLYNECVKTIVNMCVLSSYIGVKVKIPDSILDSIVFRTCLLQQPIELLNYYCGDVSIIDRFTMGIGKKLPDYNNKGMLEVLMEKVMTANHYSPTLSMIGMPEMHERTKLRAYCRVVLGRNPSVSDYVNTIKGKHMASMVWYYGGLAASNNLDPGHRIMVLRSLAGMWRMTVGNGGWTRIPLGYIAEVAKRVNANMDEVLGSSYSLKMSNVGWSLKDMPELYDMGMEIGPLITHMISVYVIKHAEKAQAITGLQKMVEAINDK